MLAEELIPKGVRMCGGGPIDFDEDVFHLAAGGAGKAFLDVSPRDVDFGLDIYGLHYELLVDLEFAFLSVGFWFCLFLISFWRFVEWLVF